MMDNQTGATPLRLVMAQAPNSRVPSSEQYVQLPSMQQLVSNNTKQTLLPPLLSPPQAESQTVVQLPSMQQLISQTAKPVQIQQMVSPPGENPAVVQQTGVVGGQPVFPGQMGIPSVLNPGGMYASNYQLVPRQYTLINQGAQSTSLAVQMSPQGAATLSPGEQFIQPTQFDQQLANFPNPNNQFAFNNQSPQMLQSPSQQFGIQTQNLGQINPGIISGGPGQNIFIPGQGMIVHGQPMLQQHTSTVFPQNPNLNSQQVPVSHNSNMQSFSNIGSVVGQMTGPVSQLLQNQVPVNNNLTSPMSSPNSAASIISPNSTRPAEISPTSGRKRKSSGQKSRAKQQQDTVIQLNNQLQLLSQLASQSQIQQNILSHSANTVNFGNHGPNQMLPNLVTQNQTLPSFGHFLLHHQQQQQQQQVLPNPNTLDIPQAAVNVMAGPQMVGAGGTLSQTSVTNLVSGQNISNIITGQNFPFNIAGASNVTNNIMQLQSGGVNLDLQSHVPGANLNIDINSWNAGQFANYNTLLQGQSAGFPIIPGGVPRFQHGGLVQPTVQQTKAVQPKCVSCVSKTTDTISTSNGVKTSIVPNAENQKSTSVTSVTYGVSTVPTSKLLSPKSKSETVSKVEVDCTNKSLNTEIKVDIPICKSETRPNSVVVPFGWLRLQEGQCIVYYSPSFARLSSYQNIKQYLSMDGTCKCGLECPVLVEKVFNFDLSVGTTQWSLGQPKAEDIGKLCNHRRKLIAMASFQQSRAPAVVQDLLTVKNVIMSPRVSSTVQENKPEDVKKKPSPMQQHSHKPGVLFNTTEENENQSNKIDSKAFSDLNINVKRLSNEKDGNRKVGKNNDKAAMKQPDSGNNMPELTERVNDICDNCKRNVKDCPCKKESKEENRDSKNVIVSQVKTVDMESESKTVGKQISDEGQALTETKSEGIGMTETTDVCNFDGSQNTETKAKSTSNESSSDKQTPQSAHGVSNTEIANIEKSNSNVTLSSIKKLVSQVSEKIAADNFSSSQKAKSCSNNTGFSNSCLRPTLNPCQISSYVNNTDSACDKGVLVSSSHKLDNMRESANFNHLLLSNMLKLTSPPNQQVFPNNHSLPPIPVQGMVRAYHHGALPNTRPVFNQLPVQNISRFAVSSSEVGQALGNVLCSYGNASFPPYTHYPWMNRKMKSKKSNSKKEKQIHNLFDSESPPPNVDVSKMKDKGHGHIPKQKIASFMENPSEFMEHQTALVNSSITSTSPSPKEHIELDNETCEPIKRSESVDSDRLSVGKRPDSVSSDRISSPDKTIDATSDVINDDLTPEHVIEAVTENVTDESPAIISKERTVPDVADAVESIEGDKTMLTNSVQLQIAASVPHTPSAVVHHPPEVSPTSTTKFTLTEEKTKPDSASKQNILHPSSGSLNNLHTTQAFPQMFPNVIQEALLQSFGISNSNQVQGSIQTQSPIGKNSDFISVSNAFSNSSVHSSRILGNPRNYIGRQMQQTPIRQILENQNTNEFPASNLLSAAARAQLFQQHNHLNLMLAQQMNGEISNPFCNPLINNNITGPYNVGPGSVCTVGTVSSQLPAGAASIASGSTSDNEKYKTQLKSHIASGGTSKISELLSQSKSIIKKSSDTTGVVKTNTVEKTVTTSQQLDSKVSDAVSSIANQQLVIPNFLAQNAANVNINQQLLSHQQLMQLCNAMGLPFVPPGSFDVLGNQLSSGTLPMANTQVLQNQPAAVVPEVFNSNCPTQSNNHVVQPVAVSVNNMATTVNVSPDKTHSIGNVQGSSAQFQSAVMQNPNIIVPNNMQELNLMSVAYNANGNTAVVPGLNQVHADLNVNINGQDQQVCSSSDPSLVVMQNGVPMIQMLAPNQMSISSNVDKSNIPQLTLSSQGVGIQNLMQNGNQCPVSVCRPVVPLNLINVQQSWNNGNTNLTAMQLQTLQLQQQLLHQIQQVQGMQSLINQFSIQGLSNTAVTPVTSSLQGSATAAVSITISSGVSSHITNSTSNSVKPTHDKRPASLVVCEENADSVSSCVITSTVKSSRPDSVSTTCSLQSENPDNATSDKVSVTAADTTQGSPVQCKAVTTRTVDIGTETEAFDDSEDDEEEEEGYDDDNEFGEENESTEESEELSEKDESKQDNESESEHEYCEKTAYLESKSVSNVLTPKRTSSAKSCYSLALESVTAQRNRAREAESTRRSRKRYYSSSANFTTVKSESPDKRLKLVIRKRTGLSPIKGDDKSRKKTLIESESVDGSQNSEYFLSKTKTVEKHADIQKSVKLKIQRNKSVCETITSLYSSTDPNRIVKKHAGTASVTKVESNSNLANSVVKKLDNNVKGCESVCSKTAGCDIETKSAGGTYKSVSDTDEEKTLDCDSSSSVEDMIGCTSKSMFSTVSSLDESEPTTTVSDTEVLDEKESKQNDLTTKIAAALTTQKGRWHLASSPRKLRQDVYEDSVMKLHEKDARGLKRPRSLQDLGLCEDIQEKAIVTTTSQVQSFQTGDLVWGQIRGFPSWPGKLIDTEYKMGELEDGKLLVQWFGDHTLTQVEPGKLKTLSEGLEAHHRARKKHRKGRKMNTNLEQAIQEAMAELDRQTAETEDMISERERQRNDKKKKSGK